MAGLSEKNLKEIVLRIELNLYRAIDLKSLGSSSFPLFNPIKPRGAESAP